jgi:hypothetical protein
MLAKSVLEFQLEFLLVGLTKRDSNHALTRRNIVLFGAVQEDYVILLGNYDRLHENLDVDLVN